MLFDQLSSTEIFELDGPEQVSENTATQISSISPNQIVTSGAVSAGIDLFSGSSGIYSYSMENAASTYFCAKFEVTRDALFSFEGAVSTSVTSTLLGFEVFYTVRIIVDDDVTYDSTKSCSSNEYRIFGPGFSIPPFAGLGSEGELQSGKQYVLVMDLLHPSDRVTATHFGSGHFDVELNVTPK